MDIESNDVFHAGDHVALVEDDWSMVGLDFVMVDVEPVPGSSQCLIKAGNEMVTVSRARLRHGLIPRTLASRACPP